MKKSIQIRHSAVAQLKKIKHNLITLQKINGIAIPPDGATMLELRNALDALNKSFHEFNAYSNCYKALTEKTNE